MITIQFASSVKSVLKGSKAVLWLAPKKVFGSKRFPRFLGKRNDDLVVALAKDTSTGLLGSLASTLTGREPQKLMVGVLPDEVSRYNSSARSESLRQLVGSAAKGKGKLGVLVFVEDDEQIPAMVNAIGKACPKFHGRSGKADSRKLQVVFVGADGKEREVPQSAITTMEMTRDSAELVDTPPSELNPGEFAKRAKEMLKALPGVKIKEIVGDKLLDEGMGGIHGVGRCATSAPRLLIASYEPASAGKPKGKGKAQSKTKSGPHIALVGKGVCYDTGGLHVKPRGGMETMKGDMGGAAAVFGAFRSLVAQDHPQPLSLLLCLAENAIGPASYKPDDILTLHSGLTVEINNTDAEGRLLLADGVSYASRVLKADIVFDAATLTGAQLVALGSMHAAVMCNDAELESAVVQAGYQSGDLAHPLPFAPEFYKSEFVSPIADMRNSVKSRTNAQSSCAAQFVYWHMEDTKAKWCHLDIAGPSMIKDRGTGYGVALLSRAISNLVGNDSDAQ